MARLLAHVRELCTASETVKYIAVQRKPVMTLSPDAIVATNRRIILLRTGLLGKVEMRDFIWRDLADARIREGVLATTFEVRQVNGAVVLVEYIPKRQARALYRICQEMEEQVREERRARSIEETRAAAGGVNVTLAAPAAVPAAASPTKDPMATLRQLKAMHEEGLLNTTEYEAKRAEVLARM